MLERRKDVSADEVALCGELFLALAFSQKSEDAAGYLTMARDTHTRLDAMFQVLRNPNPTSLRILNPER